VVFAEKYLSVLAHSRFEIYSIIYGKLALGSARIMGVEDAYSFPTQYVGHNLDQCLGIELYNLNRYEMKGR